MRKLRRRRLLTLTLWIIFITVCFWRMAPGPVNICLTRECGFSNSPLWYMTMKDISSSEQPATSFLNLEQRKKLEEVKRELNYPLTSEVIYPANRIGRYIFLNPSLCKSVHNLDFIIIVHTAPKYFEKRQRIRASFGNTSLFYPSQKRVAFLLCTTLNTTLMEMLWQEHRTFNDTVMGDFIDDYHNMTFKAVMGLRWVKDHCPNAVFVLRIDDDVVINMFALVHEFLPQMKTHKRTIFCKVLEAGGSLVKRKGKWKVNSHMFPKWIFYPYSYCQGFSAILTHDLMDELYQAAKITPFFWLDDIYVFGLLPYVIGDVSYIHYEFSTIYELSYKDAVNCMLPTRLRCPVYAIVVHEQDFWPHWNLIKDKYSTVNWTKESNVIRLYSTADRGAT